MNLRNISWAMGLVLLGSVAMPSLARKKKVQPVQKPAVQEDHLSPNCLLYTSDAADEL